MRKVLKKIFVMLLMLVIATAPFSTVNTFALETNIIINVNEIKAYDDMSGKDLSALDLKTQGDLLATLTFDTYTKWPSRDKMPTSFDPLKVIEWGKDPGLGIEKLHEMGYTGKGVNIAYIDQPLLVAHNEYKDRRVIYTKVRPDAEWINNASMHGPAVLSLLAGKNIGVAPESTVYFFGHPSWLLDQNTHAEALRKLIETNKTLSADKKIRIVGFSDGPDPREKNIEEYKKAIIEAEDNDIMVIDVFSSLNIWRLEIKYPNDKNNIKNYQVENRGNSNASVNDLCVPASGRTTAVGYMNDINHNVFWTDGGLSWTIPYVVGTIALGLQVDSTLTKQNAEKYLLESASINSDGLKIINPEDFLKLVRQNAITISPNAPKENYHYVLYNGRNVDDKDLAAIKEYSANLDNAILKDVASYNNATAIYDMLKAESISKDGELKGIQIFGSSPSESSPRLAGDVSSFNIGFKIQMEEDIDDAGQMNTDFFFSTFKNDSSLLTKDLSLYKIFNDKLNISLIPEWPVVRVPLNKGEIAPYLEKYKDYSSKTKDQLLDTVNFSSPIFANASHQDDMGYFIKERLDKGFKIINSSQYRLYGNLDGKYPVHTLVLGNITKDNIQKENEMEIVTFFINGHGQANNIDQAVFDANGVEKRVSFLNSDNINSVLNKNYFNMILWTCNNAYDMRNDNLVHKAMIGNAINVLASTTILSNNGVNNMATLENMRKNNFYYFQYTYFKNYYKMNKSMSDSFFEAQRAYVTEILKNTVMMGDGNYQFNLHNALQFQYFGLLERSAALNSYNTNASTIGEDTSSDNGSGIGIIDNTSGLTTFDGNIDFYADYSGGGFKLNSLKAKKVGSKVEFTLAYESSRACDFSFFNPPNGDKFMKYFTGTASKGVGETKISLTANEFKKLISADSATMIFNPNNNRNWINFQTSQLMSLLNTNISSVAAIPTASKVLVNGKSVSFDAYNIYGNNYFKLRDLAMALNGSEKQFEVSWDGTKNAINLLANQPYKATGGELTLSGSAATRNALISTSKIYLDGNQAPLTAYNISGNNYFKLRDIGSSINFTISWDGSSDTIRISTN